MIGALLSLAGGVASGIMGGIKAGEAAKAQQAAIDRQRAKNDAWYNRNYYGNYLDSAEAKAAMKRVEDTMRRRNQEEQAGAAVSGGTQEAVIARQENDQKMMGEVAGNLAARGDAVKRRVDAQKQAMDESLLDRQMAQYQASEKGYSEMMKDGFRNSGSAISTLDGGEKTPNLLKSALNLSGRKEGW